MITVADALNNLTPTAEWGIDHLNNDTIKWVSVDVTQPTDSEITAEVTRLQAEYDALQYQRDRAEAYPSLTEQADMQFHDAVDGTTTWQDVIQGVKDTYPKPI
jgi:hypothetical protein